MNEFDLNGAPGAHPHSSNEGVTLDEVRHVAALASLHLTTEEEPRMQHDLNAVLGHVAALRELDTTGVPPLAQISELFEVAPVPAGAALREDEPRPSYDRGIIMQEAPESDGRFFKVPKVIER